jgi:hypothetical protein
VTKRCVLGLDATLAHNGPTRVSGAGTPDREFGSSDAFARAPAIEYRWTSNLGILLAPGSCRGGINVAPSVTPAIALNAVF